MARPGGGGGSHRSSGGHSSHRSGGGHRVSSSRPSSRSSSSSSRSSFSSGRSHYSSHRSNYYVHNSYNSYGNYGKGFNNMSTMSKSNKTLFAKLFMFSVVFFAILMILIELFVCTYEGSGVKNTKNREKLTETTKFDSDCILDEENWISSQTKVKDGLEYFYDKTGIEPYVAILSYDS